MAEHTKGPWKVSVSTTPGCGFSVRSKSHRIAMVEGRDPAHNMTQGDEVVAANARVIAAAPDLLEACELVAKHLGIRDDFAPLGTLDFATKLMRAIAKARGN